MSAVPDYLQHAREATRRKQPDAPVRVAREKSEESEKSPRRFEPGRRYRLPGPIVGIIHRTDDAFDAWRREMGLPRAGIMTIEGERVIVADVRAALRSGLADIVAVSKEGE